MNRWRRDDWEGRSFGMLVKEPMLSLRWIVLFRLEESTIRKGRASKREVQFYGPIHTEETRVQCPHLIVQPPSGEKQVLVVWSLRGAKMPMH